MRLILFILLLLTNNIISYSQKKVIDTTTDTWPEVYAGKISDNGKYVSYKVAYISSQTLISQALYIKSTINDWKLNPQKNAGEAEFTSNNKFVIFSIPGDSLVISQLGTDKNLYIKDIQNYSVYNNILIYTIKKPQNSIIIKDLETGKEVEFKGGNNYLYHEKNHQLIIQAFKSSSQILIDYNLKTKNQKTIWEGDSFSSLKFDQDGVQIAFLSNRNNKNEIWIYNFNKKDKAYVVHPIDTVNEEHQITEITNFSEDGKNLIVSLKSKSTLPAPPKNKVIESLTIHSYLDPSINMGHRHTADDFPQTTTAVFRLQTKDFLLLEKQNDTYVESKNNWALIKHNNGNGDPDERYWNKSSTNLHKFISLNNGTSHTTEILYPYFSETGKYILFYDEVQKDFCTYEVATGTVHNITHGVNTDWTEYNSDRGRAGIDLLGNTWLNNDEILLLHDQYDIWQVDPTGTKAPLNLTNDYGKKNNLAFYPKAIDGKKTVKTGEKLIISAFNRQTKENGFFDIKIGETSNPEKLIMAPYTFYVPNSHIVSGGSIPQKAKNGKTWLILRQNVDESPNYFVTEDFKSFSAISDIHPEKAYKWMASELQEWQDSIGNKYQGILYKPDNFDPSLKYPVIILCYEKMSDNLHAYIKPSIPNGPINIPWFVSRGYLVFTPDIKYTIGQTGESALNAVVSGTKHISKLNYVNTEKIGIQGHSFGGYETNYIITHSNLFKAACSASGISDFVSVFGSVAPRGTSLQFFCEVHQFRLGTTPWDNPQIYIKNSPIFSLNNVTTPLLLMQTTNDGISQMPQALELFTGLRRLQKKVWLLLYKNENHTLYNKINKNDYANRLTEFFDYYLKDNPKPEWMEENNE